MKQTILILTLLAGVCYAQDIPAPKAEAPPLGVCLPGTIVNVVDGDTVDVETKMVVRVRLRDCWAPESRTTDLAEKKRGLASKDNLVRLAHGQTCRAFIPVSKFLTSSLTLDRVLGQVWVDGDSLDLSTLQVQQGYATRTKVGK